MKHRSHRFLSLLAAGGLAVSLASGTALAQSLTIDKCQKAIEKEGVKIQAMILKALQLCKDKYRQTVVKVNKSGGSLQLNVELPKATTACDAALAKTIGVPGGLNSSTPTTQVQKTYAKLAALVPGGKCTNADLAALGHLPEAAYGDAWIRWVITAMLKAAYEKQIWLVADTPGIMNAFCNANGNLTSGEPAGPTGDCPTCCNLKQSPCYKMNCRLGLGSQTDLTLLDYTPPPPPPPVPPSPLSLTLPLSGELVAEYCVYPDFIGTDIAVVGNPSRTVNVVNIPGGTKACVSMVRAEGFIKCGGSSLFNGPKDIDLCADSNGANPPCGGPGAACLPAPANATTACSIGPGPICQKLSPPLAGTADAVMLATLQIETVNPGPCTGSGGNVVPTILTTGSVTVKFDNFNNPGHDHDADNFADPNCSGSRTATVSGAAGTCPPGYFDSASLGGTTLVGGFPAYSSTSPGSLGDTSTTFTLVCQ
jgi:hypothetical protein